MDNSKQLEYHDFYYHLSEVCKPMVKKNVIYKGGKPYATRFLGFPDDELPEERVEDRKNVKYSERGFIKKKPK